MHSTGKTVPSIRPDWRFLLRHPAHFIALGFGSGLPRHAPGTWGTLAGLPLYALMQLWLNPMQILLLCIPVFVLGTWAAGVAGKALGVHDHGGIVIDEIVAIWMVLAVLPQTLSGFAAAFVVFRFFDIVKPWPIRVLDAHVPGGFGVMLDDVLAAVFSICLLQALLYFWPGLLSF
ncbi:phosphatidylglycerophosphatase A [Jeongeupia sp. HS-3]|uniref:phosphatidylglycerophosphatase A family protein n=1 Tax=Jeongeupia sp. HS-3 TaxID=1009682 RepID=UPI0018A41C71|nr:phosphatidylglycerophosphatase A [Jeongeupia sp. HS-3]BCL75047.1 phosphatidylglycerophosphatase A [Jeongeupia sp. HS-3]